MIWLKSNAEIAKMRKAGRLTGETLNAVEAVIRPGVTTKEISDFVDDFITKHGGIPSFKGYGGFPAAACVSVNDTVVHGIPDNTKIREGDIVSVDVGAIIEGYHGDAARTFAVGAITPEAAKLIEVTKQSFFEGIKFAQPGYRIGDISSAVQTYAESFGYGVVRSLVGHGVGRELHEEPDVPNFGRPGKGARLAVGMTLAIEPMINAGTYKVNVLDDGWTVKTNDGSLSAHYENSVAITDNGLEILTLVEN